MPTQRTTIYTRRKRIAILFLTIWAANLCSPGIAYALTSGPAQPETRQFKPAGVSDMVDLFTGDFKYNIPLLDVDGYPINLNYASGSGMDDEASWVGLGWNLNVGAINRQLRGLPDDMNGDPVETDHYTKPKITVGGQVSGKVEIFGHGVFKGTGSVHVGIFNDNYTGMGAQVGANVGISATLGNETKYTAGLGLGVNSSTQSGVDMTPTVNLGIKEDMDCVKTNQANFSASLGYNTRAGLKGLTLGSSFSSNSLGNSNTDYQDEDGHILNVQGSGAGASGSGTFITYNTPPITPTIRIPYSSRYGSFSVDVGPAFEGVFGSVGATGYKSIRQVASTVIKNPGYGLMYAERGKNQKNALMDFFRENDNPVIPSLPDLALPVCTPDLFSFTSQVGSGQFRLHRGGTGILFDNAVSDDDGSTTAGGDVGYGLPLALEHGGITFFNQTVKSNTRKWISQNSYLPFGDFQDQSTTDPTKQHLYFKVVGEKTLEDADLEENQLHGTELLPITIADRTANAAFTQYPVGAKIQKNSRELNHTVISYLTAREASVGGLDKQLKSYPVYDVQNPNLPTDGWHLQASNTYSRYGDGIRQPDHLSEITVTKGSGQRLVYGIPVYNNKQEEYTFAVGTEGFQNNPATDYYADLDPHTGRKTNHLSANSTQVVPATEHGITGFDHQKGVDNYCNVQRTPAYASSFLLTAVLSPDYVDKTGDGISPDDIGTAIKFNYSRTQTSFKWRTPFSGATVSRGLLADKDDDKATVIYGEKELWYLSSIETKTKVVLFITQDRSDALGVTDYTGQAVDNQHPQKCLVEIRLYSRADMSKPIKVIHFNYNNSLCPNVPNFNPSAPGPAGKLTLSSLYFEYGNSTKGTNFPYTFHYNTGTSSQSAVGYGYMETDRWGVYKPGDSNTINALNNDEFPYTTQDFLGTSSDPKSNADQYAALWQLSQIDLPTGGSINVVYESDDYAYVQDQRAMVMTGVQTLLDQSQSPTSSLIAATGIRVSIPQPPAGISGQQTDWFEKNYLNGSNYLYTKFSVKESTPNYANKDAGGNPLSGFDNDFISCYAQVASVNIDPSGFADIYFVPRNDHGVTANPIVFSAWQKMKDEYPRYAYPGFDRRISDNDIGTKVNDAVHAVLAAINNLGELTENFYHRASRLGYAAPVDLTRSFVKLVKQDGFKLGGGARVKQIRIDDNWATMSQNPHDRDAVYGQAYDYTTVENGQKISSGVAAYEPAVGCDENAMRQPVPYIEQIKGTVDDFFDLEKPFGESFFPAPTVGYSQVTVTDLNKNQVPDPTLRTGYTVSQFYTAKDFPVQVSAQQLPPIQPGGPNYLSFAGATSVSTLTMSQAYSLVVNDMHGKEKSKAAYNQSGAEVTYEEYDYKTQQTGSNKYQLDNTVSVVSPDGTVHDGQTIGRDIDFFTDFREFECINDGRSLNYGYDGVGFGFLSGPWPYFPNGDNSEYKLFRSACSVKVAQYYGVVDKVIKRQNGSSITTQNLAFDQLTGEPVVSQTTNEFDNYIYNVSQPAYWVYNGMGGAYQNAGILLSNLTTNDNAEINAGYQNYLRAGDEIVDVNGGDYYWVVRDQAAGASAVSKKLIDRFGATAPDKSYALVKVVRSGYRNMLDEPVTTLSSLVNPIQNGRLVIATNSADMTTLKVINAAAKTFNESWSVSLNNQSPYETATVTGQAPAYSSVTGSDESVSGVNFNQPIYFPQNSPYPDRSNWGKKSLWTSAIWPYPTSSPLYGQTVVIQPPRIWLPAGIYFFVYAGVGNYQYTVTDQSAGTITLQPATSTTFGLTKLTFNADGYHQISMTATNNSNTTPLMAMTIYSTTPGTYVDPSNGASLQVYLVGDQLFTTASLTTLIANTYAYHYHINPYTLGFLGNWHEQNTLVFQQSRNYNGNLGNSGVDVKDAGYINKFAPYWYYGTRSNNEAGWVTDANVNRARWVAANTVTAYDQYGQQIENVDALQRYSAALYGFNGELPVAVAANAKNREIYSNGFEDIQFRMAASNYSMTPNDFRQTADAADDPTNDISAYVTGDVSHTGNYSVWLPQGGLTMTTQCYSGSLGTSNLLTVDDWGEYDFKTKTDAIGVYPNGFEPTPGNAQTQGSINTGKYIFDVWVLDGHPTDNSVNVALSVNGTSVTPTCKAIVENWKLLEATLDLTSIPAGQLSISITPSSSGNKIYIDDLRIHPLDAQLKSYVYDDKTLRLMAELDENGFATLYEYDDEGILIRVKKETERGVMTIRETRSSYRKTPTTK